MIDDNSEKIEEVIPEIPVEPEPIEAEPVELEPSEPPEPVEETPKPKRKPGRPLQAKDKVPRPKRKVVIKEEPIDIKEELPRAIEDSLPIPTEPTTDKYALMLKLLHDQQQLRKNQKTELYRSWFVR